jgi:2-keto-4-pentenoate hydratase/2-oxohepta-3-ene-1,7-dioic acid hydratase in catechol pathway
MRLASYVANGKACFGAVTGNGVITLNDRLGARCASLREALAAGALAQMRTAAEAARPDHGLEDIKWLPVIPDPEKILCAGINYRSHAAETGRELPQQPSMFIRLANTLTGHEGELIRPALSQQFDFEGELALVIGRGGRHIPVAQALDHVAGYTCFVDGSVRDYQKISVTAGKNFPAPARSAPGW